MKDRLIDIFKEIKYFHRKHGLKVHLATQVSEYGLEQIADHLLANGVIVPPCKVGQTVYEHQTIMWMDECGKCEHFRVGGFGDPHECARTKSPFKHPDCTEIKEVVATQEDIYRWLAYGDFGKTIFLSREQAENALAERKEK